VVQLKKENVSFTGWKGIYNKVNEINERNKSYIHNIYISNIYNRNNQNIL